MNYVRFTQGLIDKGILIPATENIYKRINKNTDYYVSLYHYTDEHVKQFQTTNTVSGIKNVKTNKILFDFDDGQDIENARRDAITASKRLIDLGVAENDLRIFFSGNKGFNVEVIFNESFSRQDFVNMVFGIASDLRTFDTKINNETRIIRAPLTKHPKSGLYKIPISLQDLTSKNMEEISMDALDIDGFDSESLDEKQWIVEIPPKLKTLKNTEFVKITDISKDNVLLGEIKGFNTKDIDFSQCPRWMAKERYALQEGFFYGSDSIDKGERNSAFMILATTYRAQGFSADHTLRLLCATSEKQAARTGESVYGEDQLYREIVRPVYSPTWKGGIYGKDEELLVITRKRFDLQEDLEGAEKTSIETIEEVAEGFKNFAKNLSRNRIMTGLKTFDDQVVLTKGMMVTVVSAPGGGKTAFGNMLAENISKSNENVLYFSLDLYKNLLFSRAIQRHVGYDIKNILTQFENGEIDQPLLEAYTKVIESYSNVSFNFKSMTIDNMEEEIKYHIKQKGKSPNLVIVDYLDKVRTSYSDNTAASAHIAMRLSDIAKKYDTLVLLMAQPSKHGSQGPNEEFKSYRSLKGSSSLESDSRVILGIHREGYDPRDMSKDLYTTVTILKNNTGLLGRLDYAWDGLRGTFTELTSDQRRELKRLRDNKEAEKIADKGGWDI